MCLNLLLSGDKDSSVVILVKSSIVILEKASYKEKINRLINDGISRVGTISQSSSETSFKLFRFTVWLSHSEKIFSFAQASAHIASVNTKIPKWQIFGPSNHRAENQNFRNPTNQILLDPEFYAYHYS